MDGSRITAAIFTGRKCDKQSIMEKLLFMEQKNLHIWKRKIIYILLSAVVITVLTSCSVLKAQGIFFPTDEFGYWKNAARMLGTDITELPGSGHSYAPGYSILLAPAMAMIGSPVAMYRAALIINALLMLLASALFIRMVSLLFGEPGMLVLSCLTFPSYLIYMSYTISEVLLYVLFLELSCVMIRLSKGERSLPIEGFGLAVALLMTVTHYRTVGILIIYVVVCIMTFMRDRVSDKKKLIVSGTVVCLLFVAMIFYSSTGRRISIKTYNLFSLIDFFTGIMGKIFYVGASTFGIGLLGLTEVIKKRDEPFFLFFVLSFLYMIMLGSFYFVDGIRLDQPVYGRYGELFIPFLMYIGICRMAERSVTEGEITKTLVYMGIITLLLEVYVSYSGRCEYVADFVNGIDWMFGSGMPKVSTVYIIPFAVSSVMLIINMLLKKENLRVVVTACLFCAYVFIAVFLSWKHVWRFQDADRSDRQLAEKAMLLADEGKEVIFLDTPYNDYVNLIYFWTKDREINVIEGLSPEAFRTPDDAVVVTYCNYECGNQLAEKYDDSFSSTHFYLYVSNKDL